MAILKYVGNEQPYTRFRDAENNGSIRYGDLKKEVAAEVVEYFSAFRARRRELLEDHDAIAEVLVNGAYKATGVAQKTMQEVRVAVGIR